MFKGNDVIGKPVITYSDGEIIEKIHDIVFSAESGRVLAFVVSEGGLFASARVLPFEGAKSIGPDAVTVESESSVITVEQNQEIEKLLETDYVVRGLRVMTEEGKDLGKILDLYFHEDTGVIQGYEVSGGMFADAISGRSFLPAPQTIKIGKDVVFVPNDTIQLMEEQVGGLRGAAQQVAESTKAKTAELKEKAKELGEQAKVKAQETGETIRQKTAETQATVTERSLDQLVGRRAQSDVRTDTGTLLVASGQIVTEQILAAAKSGHKEKELASSVLKAQAADAKERVGEFSQTAGGELQHGLQEVKELAVDVWDKLKGQATDLKDQTATEIESRRIRGAIGRPVTRVVLDQNDEVILNTGDLITNKAIDQAREAGVLDMLLDSVYTEKPKFSEEKLKLVRPGK